ncbi:glycosidase [Salinibacter ruber]|nr:alpha-amylase family glycosyl hydrolase [Salinibacter ruber]MCS3662605.1 glycosidase [Salinibacter ruber]MCS3705277.1 glycosidase [Salinibacter ruber]MCS3830953.1 glycosidase [Salinibacter ruber]MCS3854155.1 glycosidase [Salinibacter ruber]MCS3856969.1 glycosidase [Salinibacter ruber]
MPHRPVLLALASALAIGLVGCASPSNESASPSIDGVGEPAWVQDATVYEVFVPDASAEGTFQGLIGRLDEIQAMGVNTLWLMPIHPIGEKRRKSDIGALGSPYSIRDYYDVNPDYGTKEDFRALVDSVHARDMHIIIDLVANHTAWDHPWLDEHPDMYSDGPINGFTVPVLNGDTTNWTDVVELDFENPRTRQEMIDVMQYWVREFNIDGYRADVAHAVPLDFWENAIDSVEARKEVLMLAEAARPEMHEVGFDQTYAWPFYGALKRVWEEDAPVRTLATQVDTTLANLPEAARRLRFTTNHDETMWDAPPPALFDGLEGSTAAFVLATSMPGAPLVYNGQELGVTDSVSFFARTPYDWSQTPDVRRFYRDYLRLYGDSPALRTGALTVHTPDAEDVLVYERATDTDSLLVAVNVRDASREVSLPDGYADAPLTDASTGASVEGATMTLEGYDYRVLRRATAE